MQDRISTYQGRVTLTPVSGQVNTYDMVRADSPEQTGTPLNTENLLSRRASATILTLSGVEPENPSEAFIQLSKVLYPLKKEAVGIASGSYAGTGATSGTFLTETFEFTPMVVIVIDSTAAAGTSSNPAALYTFFAVQGASQLSRLDHNGYETPVDVTWDDYTITLANGTGLNTSGHIYKWVVIGQIPDTGVIDEDEIDWEAAVLALIDPTLTLSDHAADAKAVGDAIGDLDDLETTDKTNLVAAINEAAQSGGSTGTTVPAEVRQAILTLFDNAVYTGASTAITNARTTLYNWANTTVTGISLNQSTLTFTSVTSQTLRATLEPADASGVITWTTSNESVATVNGGVVAAVGNGTCVITASCGGYSATCAVTVSGIAATYSVTYNLTGCSSSNNQTVVGEGDAFTATITANTNYTLDSVSCTMGGASQTVTGGVINIASVTGNIVITATATRDSRILLHSWDFTSSLIDSVGGLEATLTGNNISRDASGLAITGGSSYCLLGSIYAEGRSYEVDIADVTLSKTGNGRLLMFNSNYSGTSYECGVVCRGTTSYWEIYAGAWSAFNTYDMASAQGETITLDVGTDYYTLKIGSNTVGQIAKITPANNNMIIGSANTNILNCVITGLRVYEEAQ